MTVAYGHCQCGCGRRTRVAPQSSTRYGWVKGEPVRFIPGHNNYRGDPREGVEYLIDPASGCWVWQRRRDSGGYGQLERRGKVWMAHRYMYELNFGPIGDGLELDHLCRNRACVNPSHLEPVTHYENAVRGCKTKLSDADVVAMRGSLGETLNSLSWRFGVSKSYASSVRSGKVRTRVTSPNHREPRR